MRVRPPDGRPCDPWLSHPTWTAAQRYWRLKLRSSGLRCARCGGAIDPSPERGPWSLDVGHIVSRAQARAQGWSAEQANALTNTQPEHSRCSRSAGGAEGRDARWGPAPVPVEADEW